MALPNRSGGVQCRRISCIWRSLRKHNKTMNSIGLGNFFWVRSPSLFFKAFQNGAQTDGGEPSVRRGRFPLPFERRRRTDVQISSSQIECIAISLYSGRHLSGHFTARRHRCLNRSHDMEVRLMQTASAEAHRNPPAASLPKPRKLSRRSCASSSKAVGITPCPTG